MPTHVPTSPNFINDEGLCSPLKIATQNYTQHIPHKDRTCEHNVNMKFNRNSLLKEWRGEWTENECTNDAIFWEVELGPWTNKQSKAKQNAHKYRGVRLSERRVDWKDENVKFMDQFDPFSFCCFFFGFSFYVRVCTIRYENLIMRAKKRFERRRWTAGTSAADARSGAGLDSKAFTEHWIK